MIKDIAFGVLLFLMAAPLVAVIVGLFAYVLIGPWVFLIRWMLS